MEMLSKFLSNLGIFNMQLTTGIKDRAGFIFTSIDINTLNDYKESLGKYLTKETEQEIPSRRCFAYIYKRADSSSTKLP